MEDNNQNNICCPPFNKALWDEKKHSWKGKLFVKDTFLSFFRTFINYNFVIKKNMSIINRNSALKPPLLMMVDRKNMFRKDVYIAVNKKIDDVRLVKITGTFLSKVYENPKSTKECIKDMYKYVRSKDAKVKKIYFFYPTCDNCVKKYGKYYVVLFARI